MMVRTTRAPCLKEQCILEMWIEYIDICLLWQVLSPPKDGIVLPEPGLYHNKNGL